MLHGKKTFWAVALASLILCVMIPLVLSGRDFYNILGVPRDANNQQIRKAYRKLAKEHHPDRNKGNEEAQEKFKEIAAGRCFANGN